MSVHLGVFVYDGATHFSVSHQLIEEGLLVLPLGLKLPLLLLQHLQPPLLAALLLQQQQLLQLLLFSRLWRAGIKDGSNGVVLNTERQPP